MMQDKWGRPLPAQHATATHRGELILAARAALDTAIAAVPYDQETVNAARLRLMHATMLQTTYWR